MTKVEKETLAFEIKRQVIEEIKKDFFLVEKQLRIGEEKRPEFIQTVIHYVCDKTGIPVEIVKSKNRTREVVKSRSIIAYIIREFFYGSITFEMIGQSLGKNHASIIHNLRALANDMEKDKALCRHVLNVTQAFKNDFIEKTVEIITPKI